MAKRQRQAAWRKRAEARAGQRASARARGAGRISSALPRRARDAHKGDFGRVLVIGGSRGMVGAPALVAMAALRSGAGLVTVACPAAIQQTVAGLCPCATSLALPEDSGGRVDFRAAARVLNCEQVLASSSAATVVAIGPGLGGGDARWKADLVGLLEAFAACDVPMVIDADAINALPVLGRGRAAARLGRAVLTPHPGEMARLTGGTTAMVQAGRAEAARRAQRALSAGGGQVVLALKGAGTVITDGPRMTVNRTGNPGMATGGSGDVLTGVIAGLIAQGMPLYEAARLGVNVHGRAGDLAARDLGEASLIATDIIEALPRAMRAAR